MSCVYRLINAPISNSIFYESWILSLLCLFLPSISYASLIFLSCKICVWHLVVMDAIIVVLLALGHYASSCQGFSRVNLFFRLQLLFVFLESSVKESVFCLVEQVIAIVCLSGCCYSFSSCTLLLITSSSNRRIYHSFTF